MKKIEFKAKYANSIIEIEVDMYDETSYAPPKPTFNMKSQVICDICEELELRVEFIDRSNVTFKRELRGILIFDPHLKSLSSVSVRDLALTYTFETFASDWESVLETEDERKEGQEQYEEKCKEIKQSLRQLSIETESFERVTESPMITLKDLKNKGFIQGTTTRTISLWWHVNGERVVFICGQGIFKLSPIKRKEDGIF